MDLFQRRENRGLISGSTGELGVAKMDRQDDHRQEAPSSRMKKQTTHGGRERGFRVVPREFMPGGHDGSRKVFRMVPWKKRVHPGDELAFYYRMIGNLS